MQLTTYLNFNGQCEEAFKLYERALGGKISFMMTFQDSPMAGDVPSEWGGRIMHATLQAGDSLLQGADVRPGEFQKPQGFTIAIQINDTAESERIFAALAEGATVQMPLQETFWAHRFGYLIDRFGTPWMINCEKPAQ
jgi:PhnB protein